jgi:Ras-related protein Rab-5C
VKELQRQGNTSIVIALAGNKSDLGDSKRKVQSEEVLQFAEENGLIFLETSAKTSENVREIFIAIAKRLPKENPLDDQEDPNPLLLKTPGSEPTSSSGKNCCG